MISIKHNINDTYASYGLDHFLFKYGIEAKINQFEKPDIEVNYGNSTKGEGDIVIQIFPNELRTDIVSYLEIGDEKIPLFETPKRLDVNDTVLATFQSHDGTHSCAIDEGNKLVIGFDIFSEIGHMLSGHLEPVFWRQTDESKRSMRMPIVDILEDFLFHSLHSILSRRGIPFKTKPFWPDGKKFALVLTHDVDRIYKTYQYIPSMLKYIQKGNFTGAAQQVKSFLFKHGKNNPYWNFDKIMNLENELGVKSTFFFLNETGKPSLFNWRSWILYTGGYKIDDPDVTQAIQNLYRNGFEIGVHGSHNSFNELKLLKAEKAKLESIIRNRIHGIRQHYLNFDSENTFKLQESTGFQYDSTLGFRPQIGVGFRRGTCFPFHPLLSNGLQSSLLEIPLTIMDGALPPEDAFEICTQLMEEVKKRHGALTLLWHQRTFSETDFPNMTETYRKLAMEAINRNAWIGTASQVLDWVISKGKIRE